MITMEEIVRFTHELDREYAEEIKPMLKKSQDAIKKVIGVLYSKEYQDARVRGNITHYTFGNLPCDIQGVMKTLRFYGDSTNKNQIVNFSIPVCLIDWYGYSIGAYDKDAGLMSVFNKTERYRGNSVNIISTITELKKTFNSIANAYRMMFVDNDGQMFNRLVGSITSEYNNVMKKDKQLDDELYALFDCKITNHNIKITVLIENE